MPLSYLLLWHISRTDAAIPRGPQCSFGGNQVVLFRYLEYRAPLNIEQARQIHSIPLKKTDEGLVAYLTRQEIQALLDVPNASTVIGLRDRAMLHVAYACGLRVAELVSLRLDQLDSQTPASIRVIGRGRRERVLPLWKETTAALNAWIKVRQANGAAEMFHNAGGRAMTRAGFEYILEKHVATASKKQPSITNKRVTPHVLRHYAASRTMPRGPKRRYSKGRRMRVWPHTRRSRCGIVWRRWIRVV